MLTYQFVPIQVSKLFVQYVNFEFTTFPGIILKIIKKNSNKKNVHHNKKMKMHVKSYKNYKSLAVLVAR